VRAGGSPSTLEAAYVLRDKVPAGPWGIVGDGLLLGSGVSKLRMRFEVRTRGSEATDDSGDQVLVGVENLFVRDTAKPFQAVRFDTTAAGAAANAEAGDKLVFRITALSDGSDPGGMYVLNGDGAQLGGRIPHLQLPPLP